MTYDNKKNMMGIFTTSVEVKAQFPIINDGKFGYKRNSSTVMCTTMLLETIEYYLRNRSAAFVLYIDASKALIF